MGCCKTDNLDRLAQLIDMLEMRTLEFHAVLIICVVIIIEMRDMHKTFHGIGQLYIEAKRCHTGNQAFALFTNMFLHELCLLHIIAFILSILTCTFTD